MSTIAVEPRPSGIWWLFLLQGLAGILLGIMLLAAPGQTLVALVHFLGFYWLITGVLELVRMFADRSVPWIWSLLIGGLKGGGMGSFVLGAINVVIGLLLLGSPLAAAFAVPLVFGVLLLVQGVALTVWAFRVRV